VMTGACVYIISESGKGFLKIGISFDPEARRVGLQDAIPHQLTLLHFEDVGTEAQARAVERLTHEYLRRTRITGEWFSASADEAMWGLQQAISEIKKQNPDPQPISFRRKRTSRNVCQWCEGPLPIGETRKYCSGYCATQATAGELKAAARRMT